MSWLSVGSVMSAHGRGTLMGQRSSTSSPALLAALVGVALARGVMRPVRELVRAFDAAAAGEADYSLPAAPTDESVPGVRGGVVEGVLALKRKGFRFVKLGSSASR